LLPALVKSCLARHRRTALSRLLVRKELHPALQYLLLEAMREVHWAPGLFNHFGGIPGRATQRFAPLSNGRGILPLGPDLLATVHVLLADLAPQSNRVLCDSDRGGDDPRHWLHASLVQMAPHSSYRPTAPDARKSRTRTDPERRQVPIGGVS